MYELAFSHARTALKYGLRHLGVAAGEEILIPDYICDVALHPLRQLGVRPRFYPLQSDLTPIWSSFPTQLTLSTRIVLVVHYFGQPQDIPRFQGICRENGLHLVEDNAHGYGAQLDGKPLGHFGDVGISSPRKSHPIPSGGLLHIKSGRYAVNDLRLPDFPVSPLLWRLRRATADVVRRWGWLYRRVRKQPAYWSTSAFQEGTVQDYYMDRYSRHRLQQYQSEQVRMHRQTIYRVWEDFVKKNTRLSSVFPRLGPGASPLVFPAYTSGAEESRSWYDWGWRNGIDVRSWPTLPEEILHSREDVVQRWQRLICFPIDLGMKPDRLDSQLAASCSFPSRMT
ncbi:DegT/DnrJ/EryC1/StrS family aminotransferase [Gemmatimonadota bacterium]